MIGRMKCGAVAVLAALSCAASAGAQAPQEAPDVEPRAIAALEKMGEALRALGSFHVDSQSSLELVLDSGQKIELDTEIGYRVRQPDKLFAELKGGRKDRKFYYDGRDFTVWAPSLNYYARAPEVGKTLAQLFIDAAEKYGVELPLADLFFWGTEYAPVSSVTTAFEIGSMVLYGDRVDQFAFSQGSTDWQLWISQASSLPRKVVITNRENPSMPEFTASLHWDTQTPVDDTTFTFVPPEGAGAIVFAKTGAVKDGAAEVQP